MDQSLPPWRPLLRAAREREGRSPAARWLQLATVAGDGTPRVRTLVFRGWSGPTQLDLLTDSRSNKTGQLQQQPSIELCWLLPRARSQFRLRGRVLSLAAEPMQRLRERHWQQLTPGGRALWAWPEPGALRTPDAVFEQELPDDAPMPDTFVLLPVAITQVELLELTATPHRRRCWCADQQWQELELNP